MAARLHDEASDAGCSPQDGKFGKSLERFPPDVAFVASQELCGSSKSTTRRVLCKILYDRRSHERLRNVEVPNTALFYTH